MRRDRQPHGHYRRESEYPHLCPPVLGITAIWKDTPDFVPNYFDYDGLGNRVYMQDSTGVTYFVWDGITIIEERDEQSNVKRSYRKATPTSKAFRSMSRSMTMHMASSIRTTTKSARFMQ